MKISVIIPTYKPREYLWECLGSLDRQTLPDDEYEVIVVLNGPQEPYDAQIREYISVHDGTRWKYICTATSGVSNARNLGLDEASGEYITFVDDDDILSPACLEGMLAVSAPDCVGLCHPQAFVDGKEGNVPYFLETDWHRLRSTGAVTVPVDFTRASRQFQGPCMKLIHRSVIGSRRFDIAFRNGEDSLFMFLISDRFSTVRLTPSDAIYFRRIRKNSLNSSITPLRRTRNSCRMMKAYLKMYFGNKNAYRRGFLVTRVLGACKTMLVG